jgi:hypothetical protein
VSAFINLVVVDEVVIRLLCPTLRGLIVLARKDAHVGRDRNVGGVIKVDVTLPTEASG